MQHLSRNENDQLEVAGLLAPSVEALLKDPRVSKLHADERDFLLEISRFGEGGMHKRQVPATAHDTVAALELMNYINWERDLRGRPMYLVLTWKGDDAVLVLKRAAHAPLRYRKPALPSPETLFEPAATPV